MKLSSNRLSPHESIYEAKSKWQQKANIAESIMWNDGATDIFPAEKIELVLLSNNICRMS